MNELFKLCHLYTDVHKNPEIAFVPRIETKRLGFGTLVKQTLDLYLVKGKNDKKILKSFEVKASNEEVATDCMVQQLFKWMITNGIQMEQVSNVL